MARNVLQGPKVTSRVREPYVVLAECLEQLENGGSTVLQAQAGRPDHEALAPLVELSQAIRAIPPPLPARRLSYAQLATRPRRTLSSRDGLRARSMSWLPWRMAPPALRAAAVVLVPLMVTWSAVAPAAQAAVPGEPLYAVKRLKEQVEFATAFDVASRAEVQLAHSGARLQEARSGSLSSRARLSLLAEAAAGAHQALESARHLPQPSATRVQALADELFQQEVALEGTVEQVQPDHWLLEGQPLQVGSTTSGVEATVGERVRVQVHLARTSSPPPVAPARAEAPGAPGPPPEVPAGAGPAQREPVAPAVAQQEEKSGASTSTGPRATSRQARSAEPTGSDRVSETSGRDAVAARNTLQEIPDQRAAGTDQSGGGKLEAPAERSDEPRQRSADAAGPVRRESARSQAAEEGPRGSAPTHERPQVGQIVADSRSGGRRDDDSGSESGPDRSPESTVSVHVSSATPIRPAPQQGSNSGSHTTLRQDPAERAREAQESRSDSRELRDRQTDQSSRQPARTSRERGQRPRGRPD